MVVCDCGGIEVAELVSVTACASRWSRSPLTPAARAQFTLLFLVDVWAF